MRASPDARGHELQAGSNGGPFQFQVAELWIFTYWPVGGGVLPKNMGWPRKQISKKKKQGLGGHTSKKGVISFVVEVWTRILAKFQNVCQLLLM